MKKYFTFIFLLTLIVSNFFSNENIVSSIDSNNLELSIDSPAAILIEYTSGEIIYQKNAEEKMYPASMTKMMAIYLLLEKIESKESSFSDIVTVSTLASSMGGSQIFLKENEKMSFDDLFKAVTIASANDAVVALAEHTYGSLSAFIDEMNSRAKVLEMTSTNFVNVTGFHDSNHYTTPKDMALLAQKLIKKYGDILLKYTSIYDTYIRQDTTSPFWLVNTNKMLKAYPGMDGLKTGYTSDSGFNLTATAQRNGLRFITVVMGADKSTTRNADTATLMNYGFNNYKIVTLYKKGEVITNHTFNNAKTENTPIVSNEDITYVTKKNDQPSNIHVNVEILKQEAPISTEDIVGKVTITNPNTGWKSNFNIYSNSNVEKLKFKDIFINYWKAMF